MLMVTALGSNSHNNGNPAGDGQAGDAGNGNAGREFSETKNEIHGKTSFLAMLRGVSSHGGSFYLIF